MFDRPQDPLLLRLCFLLLLPLLCEILGSCRGLRFGAGFHAGLDFLALGGFVGGLFGFVGFETALAVCEEGGDGVCGGRRRGLFGGEGRVGLLRLFGGGGSVRFLGSGSGSVGLLGGGGRVGFLGGGSWSTTVSRELGFLWGRVEAGERHFVVVPELGGRWRWESWKCGIVVVVGVWEDKGRSWMELCGSYADVFIQVDIYHSIFCALCVRKLLRSRWDGSWPAFDGCIMTHHSYIYLVGYFQVLCVLCSFVVSESICCIKDIKAPP